MEIATIARRKIIIPIALLAVGMMVIYFVCNPETDTRSCLIFCRGQNLLQDCLP
jgi:hypothetical protein